MGRRPLTAPDQIGPSAPRDLLRILALVGSVGLPTADLADGRARFLIAGGAQIAGCVGVESYGDDVLLRSLAVRPGRSSEGLGAALVTAACHEAGRLGARRVVLLTTDAADYFAGRGFTALDRAALTGPVTASRQFAELCPTTATVMTRPTEAQGES